MSKPIKIPTTNIHKKPKFDIISLHLMKDFNNPVGLKDFIGRKDTKPKKLGLLDDIMTLLYKKTKTTYYIKVINKKDIINDTYLSILNHNYNNKNLCPHIDKYVINLETHFEDKERIFLVFEGIKRYCTLESLLRKQEKNITEENILTIYRHILEAVNFLHKNKIYGCCLFLKSFIFDKLNQTVKFTDPGFSRIFDITKDINDYELNGFKFNEYTPPEVFNKMDNISEQEKLKTSKYDMWQLGVLFYKIALCGKSPFEFQKEQNLQEKSESLKEKILNNNINYTKLDKYSAKLIQIIDKMLKTEPQNRCEINQLLSMVQSKDESITILNIQPLRNDDQVISMLMVNEEKNKIGNDVKLEKDLNNKDDDESFFEEAYNILNGIKIHGNIVNDKNGFINQEIYPEGSVLPAFKNKYLNKLHNIDQDLVLDLAIKLNILDKEYKKLEDSKLAVYNITNYVNNNMKELNMIDNENIELQVKKFNSLLLSKSETNDLYEEMIKEKGEFAQDKFKAIISNLIYEIKRLGIELEQEKSNSEKLRKKIKEQEKKILDLTNHQNEKIEFYQNKIEALEEVIFSSDNKNEKDLKNKNKLIYTALTNSIQNFTEVNAKLKTSLEENLIKFKENKKDWLEDMIKAKEDFRNEISFYLQKSADEPKVYTFIKKENKDSEDKSKNEEIEKLTKNIKELKDIIKEQNNTIMSNTNYIMDINKKIKEKEEEIEELKKKLESQSNESNKGK